MAKDKRNSSEELRQEILNHFKRIAARDGDLPGLSNQLPVTSLNDVLNTEKMFRLVCCNVTNYTQFGEKGIKDLDPYIQEDAQLSLDMRNYVLAMKKDEFFNKCTGCKYLNLVRAAVDSQREGDEEVPSDRPLKSRP